MNRLVLQAQLVERGAVRYTPAGLMALDLVLKHESQGTEAGIQRRISLEIKAVAIGAIAEHAARLAIGGTADFEGFLASRHSGRGLVFHILALQNPAPGPD